MCIYNIKLYNKQLLVCISQDDSLCKAAYNGNIDKIKEAIQGGTNVNARDKVCQYNYNNISVIYKQRTNS